VGVEVGQDQRVEFAAEYIDRGIGVGVDAGEDPLLFAGEVAVC
jgi:hypothetical protein